MKSKLTIQTNTTIVFATVYQTTVLVVVGVTVKLENLHIKELLYSVFLSPFSPSLPFQYCIQYIIK